MADRHAVASGEERKTTRREQNERISKIGKKRGSETANEQKSGNLRKTVRFEKEAPTHRRPHPRMCILNILRVVRSSIGWSPCVRRIQVMLTMRYTFLRWMFATRWMDKTIVTSQKCSIGIEMLGDLERSELNELVESMTRLDGLQGEM